MICMRLTQLTAASRNQFHIWFSRSSNLRITIVEIIQTSFVHEMDAERKPNFFQKITRYLNPHKFHFKSELVGI